MNAHAPIAADTLHSAMALAFSEIEAATKAANNPHFKSKYADIGAVIDAIKPALVKHGLFFTQHPTPSEGGVTVETLLHHSSGESLSLGSLFVPADRNNAQGFGSALTYCRRYGLVTAFGVPTEDDDGNAAARREGQSGDRAVSPPAKLAEDDLTKIIALCEAVGGGQSALICKAYQIGDLTQLTPSQAAAVIGKLNDKLADKAKETSNKEAQDA